MASPITNRQPVEIHYYYNRTKSVTWERIETTVKFFKTKGDFTEKERSAISNLVIGLAEYHDTVAESRRLTDKTEDLSRSLMLAYQSFRRSNPTISIQNFNVGH